MSAETALKRLNVTEYETVYLSDVANVFTDGNWVEKKDQASSGIRLVQTGNVGVGKFKDRRDKARFIDGATFERLKCVEVKGGDILISRLPDPVGRACILPDAGEKMITAVDCTIVRVKRSVIDPTFLLYYTQTHAYLNEVGSRCTGTTRRRISRKNLGAVSVPLPPLEEQKRIVAILDQAFAALDRARAHAEANLADANHLLAEVFRANFAADIRQYEPVTLSQLSAHVTDGDHQPPPKVDTGIPFITISNIRKENRTVDFSKTFHVPDSYFNNLPTKKRPKDGDVLYSVTGSFGIPVIVKDFPDFCFQRHIGLIRPEETTNSEWLYYMLLSPQCIEQANAVATGTAQRTVSLKSLRALQLPNTPRELQQLRAEEHKRIEKKVTALRTFSKLALADIADLRQSLLQKAFAGELS